VTAPLGRSATEPGGDPIAAVQAWLAEATAVEPGDADAAALATVDAAGRPHVRMVLVRGVSADGFDFFTNLGSGKARDLAANPQAALCLHWRSLGRQVRVEGRAARLPDAAADAYWATRARESQLSAWCSHQSEPVASRAALEAQREAVATRFADADPIPRPPFWGGFRVVPERIELWIGREHRLHDRWAYARAGAGWTRARLQP
jgi:pyridoxamine 5'-phosphate oxidase